MRATQEEQFNTSRGRFTFHVTQLGGIAAGKMAVRLGPLLPKLIGSFAGLDLKALKSGGVEALKKLDVGKVLGTIDLAQLGAAIASITPQDFDQLTVELLSGSFAVGTDEAGEPTKLELKRSDIDQLFTGHVWELFKLVGFALKINFFGFSNAPNGSAP